MVTKLNRKSLRAREESGHHKVPGRNQEVSGVVHNAGPCVACQQRKEREKREVMSCPVRGVFVRVVYAWCTRFSVSVFIRGWDVPHGSHRRPSVPRTSHSLPKATVLVVLCTRPFGLAAVRLSVHASGSCNSAQREPATRSPAGRLLKPFYHR